MRRKPALYNPKAPPTPQKFIKLNKELIVLFKIYFNGKTMGYPAIREVSKDDLLKVRLKYEI